jgi:FkbM family methyltransferase
MRVLQSLARLTSGSLGRESWVIRRLRPAYESVLDRSSRGQGIEWKINGVVYRIDPHQRHRLGENYDSALAAYLRSQVQPNCLCLDVGANVGVYVLQFAHWSRPDGRVIAFEPNPAARAVLARHVEMNDLASRVQIVGAAVGDQSGEGRFFTAEADGMARLGEPNRLLAESTTAITVPIVTLDDFCREHQLEPDWLFIDIEGFEIAALSGAREVIARGRGKLRIIAEMHPNVWQSADTDRVRGESLLRELALRPVPLTGQADPLGDYGTVELVPVEHQ